MKGRERALVLVGILFTITLAGIDGTVVNTIMPVAIDDLGGETLYAWAFAAYMLATAVSMPIWGPGSDRWGRKRTYLAGVGAFVVGSLLCAVAPTMPLFVAARAVQGIGAGAVMSLPFVVLGVVFPPERRAKALGVAASAWAISSVGGPALGSAIVALASWRWVFLLNLPIGALAALLIARGMPESTGERGGRFDLAGALLAGLGGSALIWAFVRMGEGSVRAFEGALVVAGAALLAGFVWQETRAERPILPLRFFAHRGYASAMGAATLTSFVAFGIIAFAPLEASARFGGAGAIGLVVGAFSIGWSGSALASGRILHRAGERLLGAIGCALLLLGLAALPFAFARTLPLAATASALVGIGMGVLNPGLTVAVQNSVALPEMGMATTSQQFARQIGAALGVGSFGLAMRLGGFASGVALCLVVALVAGAFLLALPASSLRAAEAAPAPVE